MSYNREKVECKICQNNNYSMNDFVRFHLKKEHKMEPKEYYDLFFKEENEDICPNCKKECVFIRLSRGYSKYCSPICAKTSDQKKSQLKSAWIGRDMKQVTERYKETCMERYGVDSYTKTDEFKKQYEEICMEKYGVKHNFLTPDCIEKRWESLNNNKEEINEKRKESWTVEKIKEVNETREKHNLEKYGVRFTTQLDWVAEKLRKTINEKYGADNIMKSDFFRIKQEENDLWIPSEFKEDFKEYRKIVMKESEQWRKKLFNDWNGLCYYTKEVLITNKEYDDIDSRVGKNTNRFQPTLDHKISIFYGFMNKIEPIVIADINNLCICSRYINSSKGNLTEEEFLNKILECD